MKAILEFDLPEEQTEHASALAGLDAILLIEEVLSEIRNKLKYGSGFFKEWKNAEGQTVYGDDETLERVRGMLVELKIQKRIPDLD